MRDFPHDCGTVDTYEYDAVHLFIFAIISRLCIRAQSNAIIGKSARF